MKIATYNINGINNRIERLLEWLAETEPDAVCLQELKSETNKFPVKAIEKAGYGALWQGQKAWNGVAILSRDSEPLLIRRSLPGDPADKQARYIEAAVNGLILASLYLPNGNPQPGPKFDYKLAWFQRLNVHAKELLDTGLPVVLAGDYNVVPTDLDIYKTTSWDDDALLQSESRTAFADLVKQGWTDALRSCHPNESIYTYWDYKRNRWSRNAGLRIDHLLLSPVLAAGLRNANVDKDYRGIEGASDHAPTWVEFDWEPVITD
jgi:exodeoxyribonuclease III